MTIVFTINAIVFFLLAIIWSKKDWSNFVCKVAFFGFAVANAGYALQLLGYIVKVG